MQGMKKQNQYKKDFINPQQMAFLRAYIDPNSESFANAYQSALKAGYSENYAAHIVSRVTWLEPFMEKLSDEQLIRLAEGNIKTAMLEIDPKDEKIGNRNLDASKFVASRLGKKKWSERQEVTGAEGKEIKIEISKEIANKNGLNSDNN